MHQTHTFNGRFDPERKSPDRTDLRSTSDTLTPLAMDLSVFFEVEKCSLSMDEIDKLDRWIKQWNRPGSRCWLHLGGAQETSRSNRLRRLGFLMSLLEQLGVPQRRVQTDDDWLKPARMGAIDDLPADVIWMQIRGFDAAHSMPPEDFKRQHQ